MANYLEISREKSPNFNFRIFFIILGVLCVLLTFYIAYRASISEKRLFSISILALFTGLLFESFRVSRSWKTIVYIFIAAYLMSLLCFLPDKNGGVYDFESKIELWPYVFITFYALIFAIAYSNKILSRLNEGITLMLSIALVYWIVDYGFFFNQNWYVIIILTIIFLLVSFSILNAVSNLRLTRTIRLILSIWSTLIMFTLAVDNVIKVFSSQDIETTKYLSQGLYVGLQYFFLGISAVYIMQNYMLLVAFLPSKDGNYKSDLKENIKEHIKRFSDKQAFNVYSLICILYSLTIYGLNFKYQILPRNTTIWFVFLTFPYLLKLIEIIHGRKNYS